MLHITRLSVGKKKYLIIYQYMEKMRSFKLPESHPAVLDHAEYNSIPDFDEPVNTFVSELVQLYKPIEFFTKAAPESAVNPTIQRMKEKLDKKLEEIKFQMITELNSLDIGADKYEFYGSIFELAVKHREALVDQQIESGVLPYAPFDDADDILHKEDGTPDYSYQLMLAFQDGKLEDSALLNILDAYQEAVEELQKNFEAELPGLETEFLQGIEVLYKQKLFPLSPEEVRERMRPVRVTLADASATTFENAVGFYDSELQRVDINIDYFGKYGSSELLKSTLWHEWMHAISGRTLIGEVLDESENPDPEEGTYIPVRQQRVGLRFKDSENGRPAWQRFRWLNEAVTEYVSKQVYQGVEKPELLPFMSSYTKEQELLNLLIDNSGGKVDWTTVRAAYFEVIGDDRESRMAAFRAFSGAMRSAYGDGILPRLDDFLKNGNYNNNLDAAIAAMNGGADGMRALLNSR